MQTRELIWKELAVTLRVLAHPDRVRIIDELSTGEQDVKSLVTILDLPGPRVSQHLSLLRAYRTVEERRAGRRRLYRLVQPQLAQWIELGRDVVNSRDSVHLPGIAAGGLAS